MQGYPFTIEPLLSLIGTNVFTIFTDELLEGTVDIKSIKLSKVLTTYMKQSKKNILIMPNYDKQTISYYDYKQGFKSWRETTKNFPLVRHLGHMYALLNGTRWKRILRY